MNDSDSNILSSMRHEPCEGHCTDCGACVEHPGDLDADGLCEDCTEHDWTVCGCGDCEDERQLQTGRQIDPDRYATL